MICSECNDASPAVESCDACERTGRVSIICCPAAYVGADIWSLVDLSRFAEKGAWPVAGGTLDQTDAFLQFHSLWSNVSERLRQESHAG